MNKYKDAMRPLLPEVAEAIDSMAEASNNYSGLFHNQVTPAPYLKRDLTGGLSLMEFKYEDSLKDILKAEDEKTFPKCPGCGEIAMALSMDPECLTSEFRVCKCGYEFWKVYSRYDIALGE